MASNAINQGAVNGIVIKPIWGTLDKQEEDDSADRFIAIVESIRKLVDSKADIDHNHDDRYYTEPEIDTKLLAIDVEISQINSKLTPMYGYCETAASVAAKTVTITNFTLVTGRTVYIKFEHENSADDPTLNISGTGAIRIVRYGTSPVSEQEIQWSDGEVKCFTYDGISWIESGGAGGGSDRSDTISFHGSDMIVEPGTNRITFDDSDMIIHPPDGAAWLERTMEALEGGISIISTNNEHAAICNGQYVYIRMHETLPDGLYKATTDIAQNAELSNSNVTSASGALNDKSDVGHTHDDRYYTESETDTKLDGKLNLSGGTMTGQIVLADSGIRTSVVSNGYSIDKYGNFKHGGTGTSDYWHLDSNSGEVKFRVYWETGEVQMDTPLKTNYGGTGASNIVDARKNLGYVGMFFAQAVFGAECINIPANSDLNTLTYTATGKYYTPLNATAQTFKNSPTTTAFQMLVYNLLSDQTGQATGAWYYRTRIIMTYTGDIFIQSISTNGSGVISYGVWRMVTMA